MKIFFTTRRNVMLPISSIESIGDEYESDKKVAFRKVHLKGEEWPHELFKFEAERLLMTPMQLIPAEPGTRIIRVEADPPHAWYTRVVAWALCLNGEVLPVTPNGVNDGATLEKEVYVEMADGSIEAVGEWTDPCRFENAQDMLGHFHPSAVADHA